MFEQRLRSFRKNANKRILLDYFNSQNNTNFKSISPVRKFYLNADANEVYSVLFDEYNNRVDITQQEKRKEATRKTAMNKEIQFIRNNVSVVDIKQLHNENENVLTYIYEHLKKQIGLNLIVEYIDNSNKLFTIQINVPTDRFANWWKIEGIWKFQRNSGETIFDIDEEGNGYGYNGQLYFYQSSKRKITTSKIIQYFKDGEKNCLINPIRNWAIQMKEQSKSDSAKSRYNAIVKRLNLIEVDIFENGVGEEHYQKISNDAQIDIIIEKALSHEDEKYITEIKCSTKPLKKFIFRNVKLNHVELNEHLYLNNIEEVSRQKLNEIKNQLDADDIYYNFTYDTVGVNNITTLNKTYRLSNELRTLLSEFEIETGLNTIAIDDVDDKELSKFVNNGTHYNATIDFQDTEQFDMQDIDRLNHIDMKYAYAQYKKCSFYNGFLGKITDFRKTDKIVEVGLYQINNIQFPLNQINELNQMMNIYKNHNVYPSPELEFLKSNGVIFDIEYGCWGVNKIDFDMFDYDFLFEKYDGIRAYAKYVGMCDSHYMNKQFWCKGNDDLYNVLASNQIGTIEKYENGTLCLSYPKSHNFHIGHFTAFITSYQRIQVLQQLIGMHINNIVRVCVDGIYYSGNCDFQFPFCLKEHKHFNNIAGEEYISNLVCQKQEWECGEVRKHYKKECHIGQGGNGKTHLNLTDNGLCKMLYVAPSWKLAEKKRIEYNVNSEVWANILSSDPSKWGAIHRKYNVLLFDEVSMMTDEQKEYIFKTYPNMKIIFCGDIGYQAEPFSNDGKPVIEINLNGFDKVIEHKINYRFTCDKLKDIIQNVRKMISSNLSNYQVNQYVLNNCKQIDKSTLIQIYKIEDMILSRTNLIKDEYTSMFDMDKWYVCKNTRLYKNGQIIIGDKPDTVCEKRHAFTVHSIQGETTSNNLFIDMSKTYDKRLLYTAISRAKTLDQIHLIV